MTCTAGKGQRSSRQGGMLTETCFWRCFPFRRAHVDTPAEQEAMHLRCRGFPLLLAVIQEGLHLLHHQRAHPMHLLLTDWLSQGRGQRRLWAWGPLLAPSSPLRLSSPSPAPILPAPSGWPGTLAVPVPTPAVPTAVVPIPASVTPGIPALSSQIAPVRALVAPSREAPQALLRVSCAGPSAATGPVGRAGSGRTRGRLLKRVRWVGTRRGSGRDARAPYDLAADGHGDGDGPQDARPSNVNLDLVFWARASQTEHG
eukprot:1057570-Pelagomonas_calceolata.AAC.1